MTETPEVQRKVHFGPFAYDLNRKQLFKDGDAVDLQPKMLETLHALALRPGEVVEKADLIKLVWPDTIVEDTGLARNISQLRRALGEEPGSETYIQTVPRRGYRLAVAAPVNGAAKRSPRVAAVAAVLAVCLLPLVYWQFYSPSRWLPGREGRADVAVMPFQGEPVGFSEALAAELAGYSHVRVISPSTIRRYRFIRVPDHWTARILGVDVMIDGEWPAAGAVLGGTARLTDVHTGRMIWSGRIQQGEAETAVKSVAGSVASRLSERR